MNSLRDIIEIVEKIVNAEEHTSYIMQDDILAEHGVDSFKIIELIVKLENTFGIEFEAELLTPDVLKSIRSISERIELLVKSKV